MVQTIAPADRIGALLGGFRAVYPAGFSVGLHLSFASARYIFTGYPPAWIATYNREGFLLVDPTLRWCREATGCVRWSDLCPPGAPGPAGAMMARAAAEGLHYGFTLSLRQDGSHSFASFARPDREPKAAEMEAQAAALAELHGLTSGPDALAPELDAALRRISVEVTRGQA